MVQCTCTCCTKQAHTTQYRHDINRNIYIICNLLFQNDKLYLQKAYSKTQSFRIIQLRRYRYKTSTEWIAKRYNCIAIYVMMSQFTKWMCEISSMYTVWKKCTCIHKVKPTCWPSVVVISKVIKNVHYSFENNKFLWEFNTF